VAALQSEAAPDGTREAAEPPPVFARRISRVDWTSCLTLSVVTAGSAFRGSGGGLPDAIVGAEQIVSGRISGITLGFFAGDGGLLLEIALEPRASRGLDSAEVAWVVYTNAAFHIDGKVLCTRRSGEWAADPEIGHEIVLLTQQGELWDTGLVGAYAEEVILATPAGEVLLPPNFTTEESRPATGTIDDLRERIAEGWEVAHPQGTVEP
jgi:hypothetical protein